MLVDFKVPESPNTFEYIDRIMVFVIENGYKGWLEAATTDAEVFQMEPLPDLRFDGYWRGVHGYVSWGQEGAVVAGEMPGVETVTTHPVWRGCEFINWKQQLFIAPKNKVLDSTGKEVQAAGINVLRIWLRPNVRVFVKVWTYIVEPFVGNSMINNGDGTGWHAVSPP